MMLECPKCHAEDSVHYEGESALWRPETRAICVCDVCRARFKVDHASEGGQDCSGPGAEIPASEPDLERARRGPTEPGWRDLAQVHPITGTVRKLQAGQALADDMGKRRGTDWRDKLHEFYSAPTWRTHESRLTQLLIDLRRAGIDVQRAIVDAGEELLRLR